MRRPPSDAAANNAQRVQAAKLRNTAASEKPVSPCADRGTLLVVDDNKDFCNAFRELFEADYEIRVSHDSATAIQIVQHLNVDVAIIDGRLRPDDVSGIVVLRQVKLIDPKIEAILITAYVSQQNMEEAFKMGACDYIAKPMDWGGRLRPAVAAAMQRRRGGSRPLNEAKLVLLGRGEVGKTCLVNRLVYDRFGLTSMTRGVQITQWPVESGGETVRLHVWDFGGQDIQHATHQFFLTERSLYLVVLNGRAGAEDEDAEYWLKFVTTFGASSPTIVVLNKFKVQPFEVNRRALQENYPFIRAFVEADCQPKRDSGIAELKRQIALALKAMDHVRTSFPAGWFEIKDHLTEMKEPFVSFARFREICSELGEKELHAQEDLASCLHVLGIALNFRNDPDLREETVLNPRWITEGVYRIITSKTLAQSQGELRLTDLASILPNKAYPPRMHGFLIRLMQKFELCFPYEYDPAEHRYLVPELLGKEEPELKEPFRPNECLNFRYDYRLMMEGLLPRFITRTHMMSEPSERWRTGVVLRWEGCRALVKADKQARHVLVRVSGEPEKRRRLLAVIRENFDQIHADMKDFKPTEWVALEGHPEEWMSYREIEVLGEGQVKELPKSVGDGVISVKPMEVLRNTDVPRFRGGDRLKIESHGALELFVSYAREDERWRKKLEPNLGLLRREGLIAPWHDRELIPSTQWEEEIRRRLQESHIILFLVSTDMLNSDFIQRVELPLAMELHRANRARVVPVIVRRSGWKHHFPEIEVLPRDGRAIGDWKQHDHACFAVEEGLRRTIAEVRSMLAIQAKEAKA